jgi:CHAT domain-containing protein
VVIADPRGNLTGARREGAVVAAALGAGVRASGAGTGWPATRAELWAARDAALLHVAGHVVDEGGRRVLPLADGDVDPAEILHSRVAPRVAVLASCGSAAAMDEEGWGSIAAALLEAGTKVVVATDRDIDDKEALAVMRALYAQPDWSTDPARALARVQQAFDAAPSTSAANPPTVVQRGPAAAADPDPDAVRLQTWAAFSVLARPPVVP